MKNAKGKRYKRKKGTSDPDTMVKWLLTRLYEDKPKGGYKSENDVLKQLAVIQEREDSKPKIPHQGGESYTFAHIQTFFNKNKKWNREDLPKESPIRENVETANKEFIEQTTKEIKEVTSTQELDKIKDKVLAEKEYEAKTSEELITKIDEKKTELQLGSKGEQAKYNEMKADVDKAKTLKDLDKIDWNSLEDEKNQKEIRDLVSKKETEIQGSMEEKYAREAAREIRDITRLEDISRVTSRINANAPSSRTLNLRIKELNNKSLSDLLIEKREELKQQSKVS